MRDIPLGLVASICFVVIEGPPAAILVREYQQVYRTNAIL